MNTWLEIRGCREPRAPLNSPGASSNQVAFEDALLGSLGNFFFEPWNINAKENVGTYID